jgi:hypothetical protein
MTALGSQINVIKIVFNVPKIVFLSDRPDQKTFSRTFKRPKDVLMYRK